MESLGKLRGINGADKSVTAGNASGVNDGAAALLLASSAAVHPWIDANGAGCVHGLCGRCAARYGHWSRSCQPKGIGACGPNDYDMDIIELNEPASQDLRCAFWRCG